MAERIVIGQLFHGHGEARQSIPPGSRIDTTALAIGPTELRALDRMQPPVVRKLNDLEAIRPSDPVVVADEPVVERPALRRPRRAVQQDDDNDI